MRDDNLDQFLSPTNKWKFVFKFGVLFWGVATALLLQVILYFTGNAESSSMSLPKSLIIFPIGGFFWGLLMWHFMAKFARKAQQRTKH